MSGDRTPIRTAAELAMLDHADVVEGYLDGLNGDSEPGDNRSKSYWHGWRNGMMDRAGKVDAAQAALAHELFELKLAQVRETIALHGKAIAERERWIETSKREAAQIEAALSALKAIYP